MSQRVTRRPQGKPLLAVIMKVILAVRSRIPEKLSRCYMYNGSSEQIDEDINSTEMVPCKYGWTYETTVYKNTITTEVSHCSNALWKDLNFHFSGIWYVIATSCQRQPWFSQGPVAWQAIISSATCRMVLEENHPSLSTSSSSVSLEQRLLSRPTLPCGLFLEQELVLQSLPSQGLLMCQVINRSLFQTQKQYHFAAVELVGPKHRTLVTILVNIAYSLALVSLSLVVWIVRDWRTLALMTTLPFTALFLLWWVLPESPRWLLAQERFDEAECLLRRMAK